MKLDLDNIKLRLSDIEREVKGGSGDVKRDEDLERLKAEKEDLEKQLDELKGVIEALGDGYEEAMEYKKDYFRLIEENAMIRDGLWPTEVTPEGFHRLSVQEIVLPSKLTDKFKKFAYSNNVSQSEAISLLVAMALEAKLDVKKKPRGKTRTTGK